MESCFLANETPQCFSLIRFFTREKDCLGQRLWDLGAIGWFGNHNLGRLRWRILQKQNAPTQRIYQIGGLLFRVTSLRFRLTAFYSIQSTSLLLKHGLICGAIYWGGSKTMFLRHLRCLRWTSRETLFLKTLLQYGQGSSVDLKIVRILWIKVPIKL